VTPLSASFFARPTLEVAPDLLGKLLVHDDPEAGRLVGRVVETEAYTADDPAMHGWKAEFDAMGLVRPIGRAADLFAAPGTGYVYRVYFAHWLLNVVTEPEGVAGAVLIRAVEPVEGEAEMQARRLAVLRRRNLTNGPAKLTQALGIDGRHHGADLTRPLLYFAEDAASAESLPVETSSRIGLTRGIDRPYRFYVAGHPFVSPGEPSDRRVARHTHRQG
jgi:DNA-3-methyladenine glycosylase